MRRRSPGATPATNFPARPPVVRMKMRQTEFLGITVDQETRAMSKTLPFAVVLAGIVVAAGSLSLFGVRASTKAPVEIRPAWTQVKWPFPLDQWGIGRAYIREAADCVFSVPT